ncbi:MAG: DUF5131 family protein [Selenomonas sp.]|nr:DUF5131 family protein [Selenomonas sp.]
MPDLKSWNLWHGCRKYSEGCDNCYMYFLDEVRGVPERASLICKTRDFGKPLRKNRYGDYKIPAGYCLRINMTSDTFLEEADEWREEMWSIIRKRPDVRFFILTKRVSRILECLPHDWGEGYENVELHMTCENQRAFSERWPIFRKIPARHKGLNLAPLLGNIDITPALSSMQIEYVGLGGEGFGGRRPCRYEWVKAASDACRRYHVNFTFNATGSVFIMNGKTYNIDGQLLQAEQAYKSGLSCFFGKPEYKLYAPLYGNRLVEDELLQPKFNRDRCLMCSNLHLCMGCVDCGSCENARLVGIEEIVKMREEKGLPR